MNYRKFLLLIISIIILIFISGCADSNTLQVVEATPTPMPIVEDWLGIDHTILVIMPKLIESTNPFLVTTKDSLSLFNLVFEPLVKLDKNNQPTTCLAKSWKVDEKGTTWTFVLRDKVYWHNTAREINSQDVIFTLDLMQELRDESIHCKALGYIKSWERVDDKTFIIKTYEPFYGVLMTMDFPILPYDVGYSSTEVQAQFPVGTGPYTVTDYRPGVRVEMQVNDNWWMTVPTIEGIIAEPYDDNSLAVSALSLGQIDVVQTDDITVSQMRETEDVNTFEYTTNYYEFLMPNIEGNILLRDKKVRQAIALALDRQEIISNVYVNHAVITESPVLPSSWLYEGTINGYSTDPQEAQRLLELAGWKKEKIDDIYYNISPDGVHNDFSLVLVTNDSEHNSLRYETAIIIAKQLAKIGIKVDVKSMDWDMFNTRVSEGYYDLLLAGWYIDDIPDFRDLFSTSGENNMSGYSNVEMDELLDEVIKQYTSEGLRDNFKLVQDKLIEDVPIISLYFRTNTLLTRSRIIGVSNIKDGYAYNTIVDWEVID